MRIAVMSDLHDNIPAWDMLLVELTKQHIKILINCGDTVTAAVLRRMSANFTGQIHTVFGNNSDQESEMIASQDLENVIHHGERGGVELAGKRIGFVHYPEVAEAMVRTGEFDLACHGHTHFKRWEKINECYILNPGTAGGVFQYPSFAIVDLEPMTVQFIDPHL